MRVAYALLANAAEFSPDGKLYLLGGDFDTINANAVPVMFPFLVIVVKFRFSQAETVNQRTLRVVPLGPNGELMRQPIELPIQPPRSGYPESGMGVCVHLLNIEFPALGEYIFRVEVDGLEMVQLPLRIRLVQVER